VAGRARAWFEHGNQTAAGVLRTQREERLAHGRGMMRKVIDDGHAVYFPAHFAAASHAFKTRERIRDRFAVCSPCIGGDDHGQAVSDVNSPIIGV